jgi:hypothetical protein
MLLISDLFSESQMPARNEVGGAADAGWIRLVMQASHIHCYIIYESIRRIWTDHNALTMTAEVVHPDESMFVLLDGN